MFAVNRKQSKPFSWKGLLFRALAVLLSLLPLMALELGLRLAGAGRVTDVNDPFLGFSEIHPLFVLNETAGKYEIAKSRLTHFQPDSFAATKAQNEFRIFVLGGSTVQGRPWSIETSFTTWLKLSLNAADSSRRYEVVNCGGVSYASYRLVPILQEVLRYEPDLIIFCEGHNEFLEDRSYAPLRSQPALLSWLQQQAMKLRTYNVLRSGVLAMRSDAVATSNRPVLGPEVDAWLDWKDGLAAYHRDPQWHTAVIQHFEFNLRRLVSMSGEAQVPLLIVSPVANLQWAPFKSEHRADLSAMQLAEFDALMKEASDLYGSDLPAAIQKLQQAVELDPEYAAVHYELGLGLLELGRRNEAERALFRAKELDVCPLRMLEPIKQTIRQVAAETNTPLVDAEAVLAALSRNGFPDNQWLVDHVHPTIEGHQQIADAIAEKLVQLQLVRPTTNWQEAKERDYRAHLASLSNLYFERARHRLKSEQGWAHGQVQKTKPKNP
jgi:tetratricopeptide (TPR) repeat protein